MAGFVPAIHVFNFTSARNKKDVDARDKPGHDGNHFWRRMFALTDPRT
jgi:hypothetical protein